MIPEPQTSQLHHGGNRHRDPGRLPAVICIGVLGIGLALAWRGMTRAPGPAASTPILYHGRRAVQPIASEVLSDSGRAALQQGIDAMNAGRFPEAAEEFELGVASDPHAAIMRAYLGLTYVRQRRYAEAMKQFQMEGKLLPNPAASWAHIADVYYAQGDLPAAIQALEKASSLQPDLAQVHFNLGMLYPQAEEVNKGIEELGKYLALEPANHYGHYLRGDLLYKQAHLDKAQAEMEQATRLAPRAGLYHYALAQVLLYRQESPENTRHARAELEQALQLGVAEPAGVHYRLATCYDRVGDWKAEKHELETTIQLAPDSWAAYHALHDVLMRLGQVTSARKAETRFLALKQQDEAGRSRAFFEQETMRNPNSPEAYYQLADYLAQAGDRAQAQKALTRAQQLAASKPGTEKLRRRIALLATGLERSVGR